MKHDLIEYVGLTHDGPHFLLEFINNYHRLSVGSVLLPKLARFYLWLNTHLCHLLTEQQAHEKTIDDVLKLASVRFSGKDETSVIDQFEDMKGNL